MKNLIMLSIVGFITLMFYLEFDKSPYVETYTEVKEYKQYRPYTKYIIYNTQTVILLVK